jgi:dihydrofolate synthase/folylpolyglutamate synthase
MATAILAARGARLGCTVSPHLSEYRERFVVDGHVISADELEALGARVAARIDPDPACAGITFFELGVALAFSWFREQRVDAAVVEVGMGGEFDATRACDPVAAALVSIDLDHVQHLGPTLADIARTKARIAPPGGVLVVGEIRSDRLGPVHEEAGRAGAELWLRGRDFALTDSATGLRYRGPGLEVDGIQLGLAGAHQQGNAATAVASAQAFAAAAGWPALTPGQVRAGLASAFIAGRLERRSLNDAGAVALLDGAHNPAGAVALGAHLAVRPRPRRRIWLYAAMADKDRAPILDALLPHVDAVWCTRGSSSPRFADPALLAAEVDAAGGSAEVVPSAAEATERAIAALDDGEELLVAGSLYLVGDVRPRLPLR